MKKNIGDVDTHTDAKAIHISGSNAVIMGVDK